MDIKSCKGQSPIVRLSMFAVFMHVWSCPSIGFPDGSLEICCTSLLACINPHWNALQMQPLWSNRGSPLSKTGYGTHHNGNDLLESI